MKAKLFVEWIGKGSGKAAGKKWGCSVVFGSSVHKMVSINKNINIYNKKSHSVPKKLKKIDNQLMVEAVEFIRKH